MHFKIFWGIMMVKNDNCFKTVLKNYAFLDVQMNFVQLYKCLVFPKSLTNSLCPCKH